MRIIKYEQELAQKSLDERWEPILKDSLAQKKLVDPSAYPECIFCEIYDCEDCPIDPKICSGALKSFEEDLYEDLVRKCLNFPERFDEGIRIIKEIINRLKRMVHPLNENNE